MSETPVTVPFVSFRPMERELDADLRGAFARVLDNSWYIVRNTRGVTGFVGPGSKPVPLSDEEVERMGVEVIRMKDIDFTVGDLVSIKSGPMEGFSGKVTSINNETRKINVAVSMFGRETPVEIDYTQVEHME